MSKQTYSASEAARALGISIDTLRRWDRAGRIRTRRDRANRRVVPASEIERVRQTELAPATIANRFDGVVAEVAVDGLLAQVAIDVPGPVRIVALVARDTLTELGLKPGGSAAAAVPATSVVLGG